ncbi:hypothetical protein X975_13822, partial [Stegodyphus mimosarum]
MRVNLCIFTHMWLYACVDYLLSCMYLKSAILPKTETRSADNPERTPVFNETIIKIFNRVNVHYL